MKKNLFLFVSVATALAVSSVFAFYFLKYDTEPAEDVASVETDLREKCTPIQETNRLIDSPGSYCLKENLIIPVGQSGITITASEVYLDLGTHSVKSEDNFSDGVFKKSYGINVEGATKVIIRNGSVDGFLTGIRAYATKDLKLHNFVVVDSKLVGIHLIKSTNFFVSDNEVRDIHGAVFASSGAYAIAIHLVESDGVTQNNNVSGVSRQKSAGPELIGEGVAILVGSNSDVRLSNNQMSAAPNQIAGTIGVWGGSGANVVIDSNFLTGFERAIVGMSRNAVIVRNNIILPDDVSMPVGNNCCYGIFHKLEEGGSSIVTDNIVVNYKLPLSVFKRPKGVEAYINVLSNKCIPSETQYCVNVQY
jgi:hypothetical protein